MCGERVCLKRDGSTSALLPGSRIASHRSNYFLQLAVPQIKIESNWLAARQGDSVFVLRNGALASNRDPSNEALGWQCEAASS